MSARFAGRDRAAHPARRTAGRGPCATRRRDRSANRVRTRSTRRRGAPFRHRHCVGSRRSVRRRAARPHAQGVAFGGKRRVCARCHHRVRGDASDGSAWGEVSATGAGSLSPSPQPVGPPGATLSLSGRANADITTRSAASLRRPVRRMPSPSRRRSNRPQAGRDGGSCSSSLRRLSGAGQQKPPPAHQRR